MFCGRILRRDLKTVQELATVYHMEIQVQPLPSVSGKLRRFRLRFGLIAGLLLGAGLIFYQSNVVETIEIQGANVVDKQTILSILSEEGVQRGTWIREIDMYHCENRLRTSIQEIAWAGIRHTGNRLVVQIAEERQNLPMLHERQPCNIISRYDAQITGVNVRSGQLCHIIGDGVVRGEMLVSGVRTDTYGRSTFLHANAEITGIFKREAELTEYFTETRTVPTGRIFQRRRLRLFGLEIPLTAGKCRFEEVHVTQSATPIYCLGFRLPCEILCETSEEVQLQETVRTEEEARLALHTSIVRYEKFLLSDAEILDRKITYKTDGTSVTADICYRLEGEIGETTDIFLLEQKETRQ